MLSTVGCKRCKRWEEVRDKRIERLRAGQSVQRTIFWQRAIFRQAQRDKARSAKAVVKQTQKYFLSLVRPTYVWAFQIPRGLILLLLITTNARQNRGCVVRLWVAIRRSKNSIYILTVILALTQLAGKGTHWSDTEYKFIWFVIYFQVCHLHSTVSTHHLTSAVIFEAGNKVVQRKRQHRRKGRAKR